MPNQPAMTRSSSPYPTPVAATPLTSRRGFTLLEIMVVVFIAGIVGMMSLGKIRALMVHGRLRSASQSVQNDVEAAFTLATRNRLPIRIYWSGDALQMKVTDRNGITYRRLNLGSTYGLHSWNVKFSKSPLEVYPNGLAADTLLVTLHKYGDTTKVWVSKGGLVKVGR